MHCNNEEIESRIREFFEQNYEMLRLEGGHALSPEFKAAALEQVLMYWQRLRDVAEKVTDTEVLLNLPKLLTPKGREFGIEGVVDIVRENDRTVMYDVKTHEADDVRRNLSEYEKQLNVYAFIWQRLRQQELDETAVISTAFPESLKAALKSGNDLQLQQELEKWEPLIAIPFNADHVDDTIREFGQTVDAIENGDFAPPSLHKLRAKPHGMKVIFAVQVCRNCDARFSCSAYRAYAQSSRGNQESSFRQYFLDDFGTEEERDEHVQAGLDTLPAIEVIDF